MLVCGAYEAPKRVGQVGSWILVDSRLEEKKIYIAHYPMKEDGSFKKHIKTANTEENKEMLEEIDMQTDQTISKLIRDLIAEYIKEELKIDYR